MVLMQTSVHGGPITRAERDALPDDGRRHELIDGALIVTPAPSPRHQVAVARLLILLTEACPPTLEVLPAPLDVVLGPDTVVEPDLLVASRDAFTERDLSGPPLLAVEVLSPTTRHLDLQLKRARYEASGCPSYWVVDPDVPSLTVWQLEGQRYGDPVHVEGSAALDLDLPFPVRVRPADLAD
jgi:Uma2 family endonuclease